MGEKDFLSFETQLGITFNDKKLLQQAFTHRSFLNENKTAGMEHNERLEFLGDAVLELAVTDYLYKKYPEKAEGELTAVRAALVNTMSIADVAATLGMNDFLLLSKGESKDTGRARRFILANTYEALIGAVYQDQGLEAAMRFVEESLLTKSDKIVSNRLWQDAKSLFQEKAQEVVNVTPTYRTLEADGPDHDKYFTVGVFLNDEEVARGEGHSKQGAEQKAAEKALDTKGWRE